MLVPGAGREGRAQSEGQDAFELEASRESMVLLPGRGRVGHTGRRLWAALSPHPHPRLSRFRMRLVGSSWRTALMLGLPCKLFALQGTPPLIASPSHGEG